MKLFTSLRSMFLRCAFILLFLNLYHLSLGQLVDVMNSESLLNMIENCEDKYHIKVYNFWATWCAPCVREMPQFEEVNKSYSNVDVILISLDDVDLLAGNVKSFIRKRKIESKVVLLDETDLNDFINKIDESWSGAIPATIILDCSNNKRLFFEQEFKEGELSRTIENLMKSRKSKI